MVHEIFLFVAITTLEDILPRERQYTQWLTDKQTTTGIQATCFSPSERRR